MKLELLLLILTSVCLSAIAQLSLKFGAGRATAAGSNALGSEFNALLQSPWVLTGLTLYGLGALLWLFVLARVPLSLAYPFVGVGFILTMLAGALVLGETVSATRAAGTLCIALGCVLVARSA